MTNYKGLLVWQKSMLLVKEAYVLVKLFPKEELFSVTSQIKRAVISVPANIAEGCGRKTKKDSLQFFHISRGSLYELETHFCIAEMVSYLSQKDFERISVLINECLKILNGLINKYEHEALS